MSQNTLKVHDLNEDAEFDENGVEVFDEKALVEEEPSDNDLAEEELLSQGATQRVLDATQLYLGEIGYSPLLTAEEEVYFARRALRGDVASRRRMIESNLRLVVKIAAVMAIVVWLCWILSKRAIWGLSARLRSLTRNVVSASQHTQRGGFVRRSNGRL